MMVNVKGSRPDLFSLIPKETYGSNLPFGNVSNMGIVGYVFRTTKNEWGIDGVTLVVSALTLVHRNALA